MQKNTFSSVTAFFVTFQGNRYSKDLDIVSTINKYSTTISHVIYIQIAQLIVSGQWVTEVILSRDWMRKNNSERDGQGSVLLHTFKIEDT